MLEVLPFAEDPDLSGSAAPALPQLLPPCYQLKSEMVLVLSQLSIECDTVDDDGAFRKTGDRGQP